MPISFSSSAELPIQDGVGTVGYTVYDKNGQLAAARSTADVNRLYTGSGYGIYQVHITLGSGVTAGLVIWDDGSGNAVDKSFFVGSSDNQPIISSAELPIQDGVGTVGYTVYDASGTQLVARTTSGINRLFEGAGYGIYQSNITLDSGVAAGLVIWDDGSGNAVDKSFVAGSYVSTLDATWGGNSADSYISLADAEGLILDYIWDNAKWSNSTGQKKDSALRFASRRIDMQNYYGRKTSYLQMLEFPRTFNFYINRTYDQIVADVKLATVFEAVDLVNNRAAMDRHAQNMAAGLKQVSESVGPIRDQYTYTGGPATLLCRPATQILDRYRSPRQLYRS